MEASRALAHLDADRLEELALSCQALNRDSMDAIERRAQLKREMPRGRGRDGGLCAGSRCHAGQSEGDGRLCARCARRLEYRPAEYAIAARFVRRASMGTINSAFNLISGASTPISRR